MSELGMIQSERLTLREFQADDLDAVHSYGSDLEVVRYMPWGPNSEEETRDFLERAQSYAAADPRVGYELAVVQTSADRLIGGIGLDANDQQAMLGYCFARPAWGQGFATEAVRLILDFAFNTLDVHRVWAGCDSENAASARVLEKVGMRREGCFKHDYQIRGVWRDTLAFAILSDEWAALGGPGT